MSPIFADHLKTLLIFGILSILLQRVAYSYQFFKLPTSSRYRIKVKLTQVLSVFSIYLILSLIAVPLIAKGLAFVSAIPRPFTISFIVRLQLLSSLMSLLFLSAYLLGQDRQMLKRIWKDQEVVDTSFFSDVSLSLLTWVISFPLVVAIGALLDSLLYLGFKVTHYEQVAVHFLKQALEDPATLLMAFFSIVLAAPIIEEILFRGFFQNYLKNKVGTKAAIVLSSIVFALFHISPTQGLGNISLIGCLFVFSLYLGFLYERQRSLFATISLHAIFNLVSALRITFIRE